MTFPIFVTQTYFNQALTGPPRPNNSSVNMQDFTWKNFVGTINTFNPGDDSCVSDVSGLSRYHPSSEVVFSKLSRSTGSDAFKHPSSRPPLFCVSGIRGIGRSCLRSIFNQHASFVPGLTLF